MNATYKILILFAAVIAGSASCGGSYSAEKAYWRINKQYADVIGATEKAPEEEFAEAVAALKGVIAKYPSWEKAAEAQYRLAGLFEARQDLKNAIKEYETLCVRYPEHVDLCALALFRSAVVLEHAGDWPNAEHRYYKVMEKYPMTTAGLEAPLYVARRYRENKMQEKSERVYGAAARRYIAFIATDPRGKKVPVLQYLMITAYANMGEWKEASGTLEKMAEKYPHSEGAPIALYRAALINRDMLKNYDRARADFQKLVDGYPLNKLTKNLKGDIAGLPLNRAQARSAGVEHSSIFERNGERKSSLMSPEMTAKQSEIITYYI